MLNAIWCFFGLHDWNHWQSGPGYLLFDNRQCKECGCMQQKQHEFPGYKPRRWRKVTGDL